MSKQVEFVFDFGGPTSYLAYRVLPKIAAEMNAIIVWTPVLLGAIVQALGNMSPTDIPAKRTWFFGDLGRWAKKYGTTFQPNPDFPINTLALRRGAIALQNRPHFAAYLEAVFSAMWQSPRKLGDAAVLEQVLSEADIDPVDFKARIASAEVKARLRENTEAAIDKGVFGCPTFFVGSELFFGQDRLAFVREALAPQLEGQS
jgi:2-hydroxychromene-2-carboxylate isomerase